MKKLTGIICLTLLSSCGPTVIRIDSPIEGQSYGYLCSIPIDGVVLDPDGIKRISTTMYSNTNDFYITKTPPQYGFHSSRLMYSPPGTEVEITIEVEDVNGNIDTKTVTVKAN